MLLGMVKWGLFGLRNCITFIFSKHLDKCFIIASGLNQKPHCTIESLAHFLHREVLINWAIAALNRKHLF